jgi:hypothetical protein
MESKIRFNCIQEARCGNQVFGVFHERHESPENDRWYICRMPASWKDERCSEKVPPPIDGNGVERPSSLVAPFLTEETALKVFKRWSKVG